MTMWRRLGAALAVVGLAAMGSASAVRPGDGPEISRSLGKKGGIVVLWPRVTGGGEGVNASVVQAALVSLARAASPVVDVRPSPERACPRERGCRAVALGAVLVERERGCAVVATVSKPGKSASVLLPWSGELSLKSASVAFREPPEAQVVVADFAPCGELGPALEAAAGPVRDALKAALATPGPAAP